MPKKPTTTRESIIEGAFQMIREKGHDCLTVRNLAAYLGCSTQPIMYQFPNLDRLKHVIYQRVDAYHSQYLLAGEDLLEIGLRYIQFADEEPYLFRYLFQSGHFSGFTLEELIRAPEVADILAVVMAEEGLSLDDAATYMEPLAALVHGYASLIANNAMNYNPEVIRKALMTIASGLERMK